MKILVTGAKGFIGKNLVTSLQLIHGVEVMEYDRDSEPSILDIFCQKADFVFNLAGVNRPKIEGEFMEGNFGFASILLDTLKKYGNKCPVMLASSIQAELDNPYGKSKRAGENLFFDYAKETGVKVYVFRFPNVFGKWCLPNYNSVVATFCYNIARDIPIQINDSEKVMHLVYIDDLVKDMLDVLDRRLQPDASGFCHVSIVHKIKLGEIVELLYGFRNSRKSLLAPDVTVNGFVTKLYSTYLSYLPEEMFSYPLVTHEDRRGSFTEILRTLDSGQFSVNISKPGITKGNHWHHSKNEKFVVVSGNGLIRFRKIGEENIIEHPVSGDNIEVVDIPPGYTHSIVNTGEKDLVTLMWCNECFDPEHPDTYPEEV